MLNSMQKWGIMAVLALVVAVGSFNSAFVYNEAGYQTHVRTIFGEEKVLTEVGYGTKWFGRSTAWKQAQTVQFVSPKDAENQSDDFSSNVVGYKIVFLGNVDGDVEASTRFRLPQGDQFLKIAREYRTPDNFVQTALVPAIKETLQSTASLMSADDYFAGARSEFGSEFENQLRQGQYLTKRLEVSRNTVRERNETAGAEVGVAAEQEENNRRSQFVTEKIVDATGKPLRKQQQFIGMGVDVVEARITNIDPNPLYKQRMVKVQTALADLAVARQDRLKEEEQKLLVTARGEKEVEEKRQETLRDQIEQTTNAQTAKQLAIIHANREKESAQIAKLTSQELLDRAKIDAQSVKVAADAEAYAKQAVIQANGALEQKLQALVEINQAWAKAASVAPVPSVMMGGAGEGNGRQTEIGQLMQVMGAKAAKDLQLDLNIKR